MTMAFSYHGRTPEAMRTLTPVRGLGVAIHTSLVLLVHASFGLAQCLHAEDTRLCERLDRTAIVFEATVDRIEIRHLEQDPNARVMGPDAERLSTELDPQRHA